MADLRRARDVKLHLEFRDTPRTELKGILVPMPDGRMIVNLSFGISILNGVQDYSLTKSRAPRPTGSRPGCHHPS